jgi:N-acetylglutamate synthase-like GNAT family acetyltransferase
MIITFSAVPIVLTMRNVDFAGRSLTAGPPAKSGLTWSGWMQVRIEHLMDWKHCIPTVAAWQQVEFGYLNPTGTAEQRAERLSAASERGRLPISLVALSEDRNELVGSANLVATMLTHKHLSPWLSSVVVPSQFRGKAIASKLALAAVAEASRLGFDTIYLFTPHNESLYARLGWTTFDRTEINGVGAYVMSRNTR